MTRKLAVLVAVGLVLAPAASAKGPHAVIRSGPDAVEPGRPWVATLEFAEFARPSHPLVVASRGDRRVRATLRAAPARALGASGFRMRMVFPSEGRWRLAVAAGNQHFEFPAVAVGSGTAYPDYVGFPKDAAPPEVGDTALPPEVIAAPVTPAPEPPRDHGLALWIPALGLALVGAGAYGFRARR
jgi:hypothetical protein